MDAALNGADAHIIADANYTKKTIITDEIVARVGGTYELTVKILPFINFVIYDKNNRVISVRGGTISIDGTTVTIPGSTNSAVYYEFAPDHTVRNQLQNPTKEDYLNAKTAPTASVPFNNIWRVNILWEVGKGTLQEGNSQTDPYFKYEETRLYTCTGAREPNNEAIISNSTIPVDIT